MSWPTTLSTNNMTPQTPAGLAEAMGGWSMPAMSQQPAMPMGPQGMQFGMPATGATPQPGFMGQAGQWLGNGQNLSALATGLSALSGMFMGQKQLGLAKENLGFQRMAFNANLNNQTQSYNTSLEDRIRGRSSDYEGKENDVRSYLDQHALKRG